MVGVSADLWIAFSCALSREILLQGRLFLSERHVCFHANILGWITNVVIALEDIVLIERKNTALVFPNAILISTLHHRYFFASFLFREQAFTRLLNAWKTAIRREGDALLSGSPSVFSCDELGPSGALELDEEMAAHHNLFASHPPDEAGHNAKDGRCCCGEHLSESFVHVDFPEMDCPKAFRTLFEDGEDAQVDKFYLGSGDTYLVGPWSISTLGLEQRSGSLTFEGSRGNKYKADFTETLVTSRSHPRITVESCLTLDGVAGKGCSATVRYALTDKARAAGGCHLCISFKVTPGPDILFKESVKKLVAGDLYQHYVELGEFLLQQAGGGGFCETASPSSAGSARRSSSGSIQVYFDRAAFMKSALWILPTILLAAIILCLARSGLGHGTAFRPASWQASEEKVALVMRDLSDQLARRLLRGEQVRQKLTDLLGSMPDFIEGEAGAAED